MQAGYTLSQLSERTGVKPRTLQFWASNGVIEAEKSTSRKGTGVHRRWPSLEVEIAAVLGELERYGVTVGTLHALAAEIRGWKAFVEALGIKSPAQLRQYIREEHFLRHRQWSKLTDEEATEALHLEKIPDGTGPRLSLDDLRYLQWWEHWITAKYPEKNVFMRIRVSADESWSFMFTDSGSPIDWDDTGNSFIVIRLSKILKSL
jgi:DNA-binding transcriptional MerR regulator